MNTDLADIVDDKPMPLHPINNTILWQNVNRTRSDIEFEPIQAKGSESSVIASSSQTSQGFYRHPPHVEVDEYRDAFKHVNMGPHSQSFVTFTPNVEKHLHARQKVP